MIYKLETEDEEEFKLFYNGPKLSHAAWEFSQILRFAKKHDQITPDCNINEMTGHDIIEVLYKLFYDEFGDFLE